MQYIRQKGRKVITETGEAIQLRGFGLGGWLLPEGYMWKLYTKCDRPRRMEELIQRLCGKTYEKSFWKRYFETYITEQDIILIKQWGFNSVRLPINSRKIYYLEGNEVRLKDEGIIYVDRCVEWCRRHDIYIILDMHGAPGGQTGTNIDDSEKDLPELFIEESYQDQLVTLWKLLADRYKDEACIAGYDLLNEPLPEWFAEYNAKVMPLYRRIRDAIRQVDQKHMIILEGVHWATDLSIFEELREEAFDENWMLQFHKYWSAPDRESITSFIEVAESLNVPLLMGEGGENNIEWYSGFFPMLDREGISYSFWSYKKMAATNSPITFEEPKAWQKLIAVIAGEESLERQEAIALFDEFLDQVSSPIEKQEVFRSLTRTAPIHLMAEYFDEYAECSRQSTDSPLRRSTGIEIGFVNGKTGEVDYKRYGGEAQPEEEKLYVRLTQNEWVNYWCFTIEAGSIEIGIEIKAQNEKGVCSIRLDNDEKVVNVGAAYEVQKIEWQNLEPGKHTITVTGIDGIDIKSLLIQ